MTESDVGGARSVSSVASSGTFRLVLSGRLVELTCVAVPAVGSVSAGGLVEDNGDMDDVSVYLDTAEVTGKVIADGAVAAAWERDSALAGMRVSALAGHLARSITLTAPFLDEEPAVGSPLSTAEYYLAGGDPTDFDSRANRRIRESGAETAAHGHAALCAEVDLCLRRLRRRLPDEDLNVPRTWFGRVTTLRTVLRARMLEMVVHADDLVASVGMGPPALPGAAFDLTIEVLVDIARLRHTDMAVVRALTRRERDEVHALRVL